LRSQVETAKEATITTLQQQSQLAGHDNSTRSSLLSERDNSHALAAEIRNLRQQLLDEKEVSQKERDRADAINRESDARSKRLLDLQESLTLSTDENTRLSRALEQDRLTAKELRRKVDESSKEVERSGRLLEEKAFELKEKTSVIDDVRASADGLRATLEQATAAGNETKAALVKATQVSAPYPAQLVRPRWHQRDLAGSRGGEGPCATSPAVGGVRGHVRPHRQ
jgi:hypothetical protein